MKNAISFIDYCDDLTDLRLTRKEKDSLLVALDLISAEWDTRLDEVREIFRPSQIEALRAIQRRLFGK